MSMTPDDVRAARFTVAMQGYDMAQMDAFLAEIAAHLTGLQQAVWARQYGQPAWPPPPTGFLTGKAIKRRPLVRTLRGYAIAEVDMFLDRAAHEFDLLWRYLGGGDELAFAEASSQALETPAMTSQTVRDKRFQRAGRGYAIPEVDRFLDRLTETLDALDAEIQRREWERQQYGQASPPNPLPGLLAAREIREVDFASMWRGYSPMDVNEFLDQAIAALAVRYEWLRH